ncbi:phosphatase PAP2 family protein [Leptolyngbya sp. KIOST-1]|uniref:phosphatase PAP2 family protein n=1 Tax=Leptolyngbya sp. KIOST-1 TaxID=1229172 RepID=UPI0005613282|nr:phosphatase PAP2 family protein [Leptolyngbya sp. KIOST-1]
MQLITQLGSEVFFLMFVSLLYWCVNARLGIQVALLLLLSTSINSALKLAFATPRPYWFKSPAEVRAIEVSFGLPSAHAQNAVVVWGLISQQRRHPLIKIGALLLIFLIGLSRIYLDVHFVIDVLTGWLAGAVVLFLFNRWVQPMAQWFLCYPLALQMAIALLSSLALLLPSIAIAELRDMGQFPLPWLETLQQINPEATPPPFSLEMPVSVAGTWLGLAVGLIWLAQRQPWQPTGTWQTRIIQYLIGIVVAVALWAGLAAVFPSGRTPIAYGLRYGRYALVGGWIGAGAPTVFRWMRRI